MKILTKKRVSELYNNKGYCAREVGDCLGVSQSRIYKFMRKTGIVRRNSIEQNKLRFEKKPLSFCENTNLDRRLEKLRISGLMLYWAEGYKCENCHTVDLANCDPEIIKLFLAFLRKVFTVDEKRLRIYLYCYSNQNVEKLIDFWAKATDIPVSQFTKPYIRHDFKDSNPRKMKYGLVHVRYSDKKLYKIIFEQIENEKTKMLG